MISSSYNLTEFAEAVRDREVSEIIRLAEKEALETWRVSYRTKHETGSSQEAFAEYENGLKDLINFLRDAVKPADRNEKKVQLFHSLTESVD
jgi:hypothetical protein